MARFSVIIPLYNKEADIEATINSVLAQSFNDFELVIINDGSTDDSLDVALRFKDERITIKTIENKGVANARNQGAILAKSEHIAFLDGDDYWHPNHLENLQALITRFPKQQWYATAYEIKHNEKMILAVNVPSMEKGSEWMGVINDFFGDSMHDCVAWTSAVCFKTTFFMSLGGFDIKLRNGQDTDLWIRAALSEKIVFTNTISSQYNFTATNRISTTNILEKTIVDFDKFSSEELINASLKRFLDFNRYSVALLLKANNDINRTKHYTSKINYSNISFKQKILLGLPSFLIRSLLKSKQHLEKHGVRLRSN